MASVGQHITVVLVLLASISVSLAKDPAPEKGAKDASTQTGSGVLAMFAVPDVLRSMEVIDLLRSGAMLVAFLAILFWDRRQETWTKTQFYISLFGGLQFYFAPASSLSAWTTGQTNFLHEYFNQILGAMHLANAAQLYYQSNDGATRFSFNLMQSIASLASLMIGGIGYVRYSVDALRFSNQYLTLALFMGMLYFVGNLLQLYRQGSADTGRSGVISKGVGVNDHLLLDAFFCISIGVVQLGFPDLPLSTLQVDIKPDGILATCVRYIGMYAFYVGIQSLLYCSLSNENDKRAALFGRVVLYGSAYPLFFLYQWKHGMVAFNVFVVYLLSTLIPFGNAMCALYLRNKGSKRL